MTFDIQSRISEYRELVAAISKQIDNTAIALAVMQEIRKDMREESNSNAAELSRLGSHIQQQVLTRNQASKLIADLDDSRKAPEVVEIPFRIP